MKKIFNLFAFILLLQTFNINFSAAELNQTVNLQPNEQDALILSLEDSDYIQIKDTKDNNIALATFENGLENKSNDTYFITTSSFNPSDTKTTKVTLTTNYYVYHGYLDYIGQTTRNSSYTKHYTSTGQPYYYWDFVSGYTVTYREDGFRISSTYTHIYNTSTYKSKSKIKEVMGWSTKYGSTTSTSYFYAPTNK